MIVSPRSGKPAEPRMPVNIPKLVTAYYTEEPDPSVPALAAAIEVLAANGVEVMIAEEARVIVNDAISVEQNPGMKSKTKH